MNIFDYSYYRVTKAYSRWDGTEGSTSIIIIALVESLFLLNVVGVIVIESFTRSEIKPYSEIATVLILVVFAILVYLNMIRYRGKYFEYDDRWGNETSFLKIIKGILVIILILIPIIFPAIILNLKDYTK